MISPQAMPLAMVPTYSQAVAPQTASSMMLSPNNPFWNMAGQASASQAATNSQALQQSLQATVVTPPGPGCDLASQFALGLVLLILLLMHH